MPFSRSRREKVIYAEWIGNIYLGRRSIWSQRLVSNFNLSKAFKTNLKYVIANFEVFDAIRHLSNYSWPPTRVGPSA